MANNRVSYLYGLKHLNDNFKNLGFQYQGKILSKTLSHQMYANPIQQYNYLQLEKMIIFLINKVKMIKKSFSIAHSKDDLNIN